MNEQTRTEELVHQLPSLTLAMKIATAQEGGNHEAAEYYFSIIENRARKAALPNVTILHD